MINAVVAAIKQETKYAEVPDVKAAVGVTQLRQLSHSDGRF